MKCPKCNEKSWNKKIKELYRKNLDINKKL